MEQTAPLVRGIRRWDLVALGINCIIGAGIFGLPSRVFAIAGPASVIAYLICASSVFIIATCFAEVSSRFTETGGPYLYARRAFGPLIGFEIGWLRWLSGLASFAANVHLLVDYLAFIWAGAGDQLVRAVVVALLTALLTAINIIGVRTTASASNVFAVAKLLPLLFLVTFGLFAMDVQRLAITEAPDVRQLSTSVLLLVHAFTGFESIGIPAGEVKEPQRTVPFALFTVLGIVGLLYVAIQAVCIGTLPDLATSVRPLADAGARVFGLGGGALISAAAVVSIIGNLNAQLLVTPRTLYAMAEQRQLPRAFARVNQRFRTPHTAILLSSAVILGFALSGTFVELLRISVISRLLVYTSTCAAVPFLRRRGDAPPALFTAPWGITLTTASLGICAWLMANSSFGEAVAIAALAAVGLVLYVLHGATSGWRR